MLQDKARDIVQDNVQGISRDVDVSNLVWVPNGGGLVVNREEVDLRGLSWSVVRETLALEDAILQQIDAALRTQSVEDEAARAQFQEQLLKDEEDRFYEEALDGLLGLLDIGVASAVAALSAAKCVPVFSCRGGPGHMQDIPSVTFRARPERVPDLLEAAEEAHCGLENTEYGGGLILYADDFRKMIAFARALVARRRLLRQLAPVQRRRSRGYQPSTAHQLALPLTHLWEAVRCGVLIVRR